jgi:hypothetical protein
MFCRKCGVENDDKAKFCKKCGAPLSVDSTNSSQKKQVSMKKTSTSNNNKNIIIICLTVIICVGLIGGSLAFMHFNKNSNADTSNLNNSTNNTNESNNKTVDSAVDSESGEGNDDVAVTDVKANSNNIKILSGEFYTGNKLSDKTYCDVYVGEQFAGINLKIQIWYSRDGNTLNPGNIVPKTVSDDGYVSLRSANAFKYYPDHASITLYDTAGNILDTKEVEMSASKGTQTF